MTLQLGKGYKEYFGKNIERLPLLLADGNAPASVARIMHRRLDMTSAYRGNWVNNYADSSDLVAYDSVQRSEKVKFALTCDNQNKVTEIGRNALGLINLNAPLVKRAVKLSPEQYDSLVGAGVIELERNKLGELDKWLTKEQVLASKVWRILARHPGEVSAEFAEDERLLSEYADMIFTEGKQRYSYDTAMGIFPDTNSRDAKLRAWCVYRLDYRSRVNGRDSLDFDIGRFVGLAPEVQIREKLQVQEKKLVAPTLEQVLALGSGHISKAGLPAYEADVKRLFEKQ